MKIASLLIVSLLAVSHLATGQGPYCYPATTVLLEGHQIQYFELADLVNITGDINIQEYNDFSDSLTINIEIGRKHQLVMSKEPDPYGAIAGNTLGYTVWVDYNDDTTFAANEKIYSRYWNFGIYTYIDSLYFSKFAACGKHRLRVRNEWGAKPDLPCDNLWGGETEDYTIYLYKASTVAVTSCASFTVPSGDETYTSSGTYKDTILAVTGCDSIITFELLLDSVNIAVSQSDSMLTANAFGASYQWIDCNNGNSPIVEQVAQSFTGPPPGNYAVVITQDGCSDTSSCYSVVEVGILQNTLSNKLTIYPNPTTNLATVSLGATTRYVRASLRNVIGETISMHEFHMIEQFSLEINGVPGFYFIEIETDSGSKAVRKILKQ